ncbi:MAG: hypothetical protein KY476_10645 [Planctomycetes bacterium]|nr:hypothetical protein [Planctomycetota bacterium]
MPELTRRRFLTLSALAGPAGAALSAAAEAEPAVASASRPATGSRIRSQNHNDPDLHLLIDDEEIAHSEGLLRVVNRPKKHGPVLVSDRPWEGERAQAWGSVILEPDGRLRIWYFAFNTERRKDELDRGGYCYAESTDGVHWEKPGLGLVEFRDSKDNNLFYSCHPEAKNLVDEELARRGLGLPALDENGREIGVLNNLDGLTVVRDDDEPNPAKRYKLIANMQDHRMWAPSYPDHYPDVTAAQVAQARRVFGQYMDTSPDGLRWTRRPRRILSAVGDYMMVTRDHRSGRWWLNERASSGRGRNAALRTSTDLVHWSEPEIIFDNEEESGFGRLFEWHGGITPFNYGNLNLGLLEKWPNAGFGATCELVSQREGGKWRRAAPGTPFLDIGPEGAFDRTLIYPTHNAPIRIGETLYIFYTGGGAKIDPKRGIPMSIGLATIGVDRFAGLASWRFAGGTPGRLVTRPITVSHAGLEINVGIPGAHPGAGGCGESRRQRPSRLQLRGLDDSREPGNGLHAGPLEDEARRLGTARSRGFAAVRDPGSGAVQLPVSRTRMRVAQRVGFATPRCWLLTELHRVSSAAALSQRPRLL